VLVQVVWIYASEDDALARQLLRLAAVLEQQGLIQNTSFVDLERGQLGGPRLDAVRRADVAMFLCSEALLEGPEAAGCHHALAIASKHTRVVPVLLSSTKLPPELAAFQVLPRDGNPIQARRDRDEALLEVIQVLQEIVNFRPDALPAAQPSGYPMPAAPVEAPARSSIESSIRLSINDIFPLDGPPTATFVEPPRFSELQLALRRMGTGLIVEGPSKVGKSTAIQKAMKAIGVPEGDQIWWSGQRPPPLDDVHKQVDELIAAKRDTWLFIDDFHHLEDARYRRELASGMKVLADKPQDNRHGKITLIGLNPLGACWSR